MSPDSTSASLARLLSRAEVPLDHLQRYQLAARIVGGRVIDLACGAGYGTAMLGQRAERVWGIDRSTEAVAHARRRFGAANCRYLGGDPERLPFPGGSFDFVAWFGSEEAEGDFETVLDEAHRVLAASGVLLISLPRSPDQQPAQTALLGHRFAHVRLFGQAWDAATGAWRLAGFRPGTGGRLEHLMAVCSHLDLAELVERSLGPQDLADVADLGDELLRDHVRRETETRVIYEKVVEDLRSRLKAFDSRIRRLGHEVEQTRGQQVADLLRRIETLEGRVVRAEGERDTLAKSLYSIHDSRMWRLWMVYHRLLWIASPAAWLGRLRRLYDRLEHRREAALHVSYRIKGLGIRALRAVHGLVRRAAFHGGLKVQRVLVVVPHLLGLPYLMLVGRIWRSRAERRRAAPELPVLAPPRSFAGPYGRRPRVLLVSPYPIYPPNHGGAVRIFNLIKRISAEVDLHLLIFSRAADDSPQAEALAPYCASLHFHHWRPYRQPDLWGLRPPGAQLFRSREVAERLRELVEAERIDVLQLEYTELGQYADAVPGVKTILTEIDLTFRSRERRKAAGFHRRYAHDREFGWSRSDFMRLFRFEIQVCSRADQVHVMSEADGAYLASFMDDGTDRLRVVPNAVDCDELQPPPEAMKRTGALFVGNFQHLPNVDAFDFLIEEIWPEVRRLLPDARLTVVGAHTPRRVAAYHGRDGVEVIGAVPEVVPYYQRHRVLVAPIRAGSGTRLKILEAMACGMPVVSTAIGAEGIDGRPGEHFLEAESPEEITAAVVRLLTDDQLARRVAARGRELVTERYDWRVSADQLLEAYRELLPEPERHPEPPEQERERRLRRGAGDPEVSVIIPTLDGGEVLARTLDAVLAQRTERRFEVICVDSSSAPEHRAILDRFPVRVETIDRAEFNHGLTRDRGAALARGEVLVFLNQDAVPADEQWLARLVEPLFAGDRRCAAVQGGIREVPDPDDRFYWDSCGHRFYFTSESDRWIERFGGVGFSTVNAALRRDVWRSHRFGYAPIMEDKQWQRAVVEAGYLIDTRGDATVVHTHDYDLDGLVKRCVSEGFGWRHLGEPYRLVDMLRDLLRPRVYADLVRGLARGRVRSAAELLFPWLRPLMLYRGSRFSRGIS